jgi:hypothetical protein
MLTKEGIMEKYLYWILTFFDKKHYDFLNELIDHGIINYEILENFVLTISDDQFVGKLIALKSANKPKLEEYILSSNNLSFILEYSMSTYLIDRQRVEDVIYQQLSKVNKSLSDRYAQQYLSFLIKAESIIDFDKATNFVLSSGNSKLIRDFYLQFNNSEEVKNNADVFFLKLAELGDFQRLIDITMLRQHLGKKAEKYMLMGKGPYHINDFLKRNIDKEIDIPLLQEAVISTGNIYRIIGFAQVTERADIIKLQDIVIQSEDLAHIIEFSNIPGSTIKSFPEAKILFDMYVENEKIFREFQVYWNNNDIDSILKDKKRFARLFRRVNVKELQKKPMVKTLTRSNKRNNNKK